MTAAVFTFDRELAAIRTRTRRSHAVSLAVHVAVLLWLALHRHLAPPPEQLVEITWLEPAVEVPVPPPLPAPAAPVVAAVPEPAPAPRPTVEPRERRFERSQPTAEQSPQPQDAAASRDAVRARLEDLRATPTQSVALAAAANPGARIVTASTAPRVAATDVAGPRALERTTAPAAAAPLTRSAAPASRPSLAAAAAPTSAALSRPLSETPPAAVAERLLGAARLSGEIADRAVLEHTMPVYPAWATREAVEADVTLSFAVLPDGRIKDGIQVARTAGFLDFDDAAVAALRGWRFAPLPAGKSGEQRGSITFHFRLRDQR